MVSDDGICGEPTGPDGDGPPCERDAGWGTDSEIGPCRDHAQEFTRPDKMTEEVVSQLCGAAQRGLFKKHTAQIAGITPRTLRNWLADGREHAEDGLETPQADFFFRYQRARAAGAAERINEASPEFILERSYGYTKTEALELSGPEGGPIQTEEIDEEERAVLLEAFEEEPET